MLGPRSSGDPAAGTALSAASASRRVVLTDDGPVLVEGPVEVTLPDGRLVTSDRPVVALCVCRRSKTLPFCDTSHRQRVRPGKEAS